MVTVLQYLVIAAAIGAVVFVLVALVFGRGEQLSPLPARTSPAELPEHSVSGTDVRALRFAVALRGYRMTDVDWSLEKIADELDRMRAEVTRLGGDPDEVTARGELLPVAAGTDVPTAGAAGTAGADSRSGPALGTHPADGVGHPGGHDERAAGGPEPDGGPTTTLPR